MDVLILCAGEGKRLRPLTSNIPKPLLQINANDSILSRLLRQLADSGVVNDVYVNISYLSSFFLKYVLNLDQAMRPNVILEESPLGSAITLKRLLSRLSQPLLVLHGDLILDSSQFSKMLIHFDSFNKNSFMVGHRRDAKDARSVVCHDNYKINYFQEITSPLEIQGAIHSNSGIYFFAHKDLENLKSLEVSSHSKPSLIDSIVPNLVSNERLFFYSWDNWRYAIDSIGILDEVREMFAQQLI